MSSYSERVRVVILKIMSFAALVSLLASFFAVGAATAADRETYLTGNMQQVVFLDTPVGFSNYTVIKPDGSQAMLGDLPPKTRIINMWAKWCAPCRKEMPTLAQLQASQGDDNFEVMAVAFHPRKPKTLKAIQKTLKKWKAAALIPYRQDTEELAPALVHFNIWKLLVDGKEMYKRRLEAWAAEQQKAGKPVANLQIQPLIAMPTTLLVDAKARIIGYYVGDLQWNSIAVQRFVQAWKTGEF